MSYTPRRAACAARRAILLAGLVAAAASPSGAETRMLIVAGLGGEPDYARAFADQANAAARHAEAAGAIVTLLTEESARREHVRNAIAAMVDQSAEGDAVVIHLIGHGTFDEEHYRFNVPGPDPTAQDLAGWLEPLSAKRQLAVVATSASGAAQEPLKREGRAVITATRNGRERNATVFGGFWTDALVEPGADLDKDERIAAEEAFRFAERAVADHFEDNERIATEHPRLEGDAAAFVLARTAPEERVDPELVQMVGRIDQLTEAIAELKADRRVLTDDEYFARLQDLLMELAQIEREINDRKQHDSVEQRAEDDGATAPSPRGARDSAW